MATLNLPAWGYGIRYNYGIFKQLIKDARLELKVYDITQMTRLFNLKGGAKGIGLDSEDGTSLGVEQFLTLLINLAFYRENPRYTPQLPGAPKMTQETVPLLQCVTKLRKRRRSCARQGNAPLQ
jgi:glucan phosphorylase